MSFSEIVPLGPGYNVRPHIVLVVVSPEFHVICNCCSAVFVFLELDNFE